MDLIRARRIGLSASIADRKGVAINIPVGVCAFKHLFSEGANPDRGLPESGCFVVPRKTSLVANCFRVIRSFASTSFIC